MNIAEMQSLEWQLREMTENKNDEWSSELQQWRQTVQLAASQVPPERAADYNSMAHDAFSHKHTGGMRGGDGVPGTGSAQQLYAQRVQRSHEMMQHQMMRQVPLPCPELLLWGTMSILLVTCLRVFHPLKCTNGFGLLPYASSYCEGVKLHDHKLRRVFVGFLRACYGSLLDTQIDSKQQHTFDMPELCRTMSTSHLRRLTRQHKLGERL